MLLLHELAEREIEQHLKSADASDNAFAGRALDLSVDMHVPSQLRALYRVLKHNGYVPAEVELRNEMQCLSQLLMAVSCEAERGRAAQRLQVLQMQLENNGRAISPKPIAEYQQQLLEQLHQPIQGEKS